MSTLYELTIIAEGDLTCDASDCTDECPIHGTTTEEIDR
jgi:hypothetical protein